MKPIGFLALVLLATVSVAYDQNMTLANETVSGGDLPHRFVDVFIRTTNVEIGGLGVNYITYFVVLLFCGIIFYLIRILKWGGLRRK